MQALLATPPVLPDYHFCDASYSNYHPTQTIHADCLQAEALMPRGTQALRYHGPSHHDLASFPRQFPLIYRHGTCEIAVEAIDLNDVERPDADSVFDIVPDNFRGMAGWVIRQCVQDVLEIGGFVTRNISETINYLQQPTATLEASDWPLDASFFTVSVQAETAGADMIYPGHYDPTVGGVIFSALFEKLMNTPFNSPSWNSMSRIAERINYYWGNMVRDVDGTKPWYGNHGLGSSSNPSQGTPTPSKDTTTYKCDAKLGRPKQVDCSQLLYSKFSHLKESLSLQPGVTQFLHSETCNIGVSVSKSTTITWQQIKSGVAEIIEACVNNPLKPARGGRAFYGHQPMFNVDIAGKRRKRDSDALNALPPGVNITLFQQFEIFRTPPTDREEVESCTWQKALEGKDLRPCRSVHHHANP